MPSIATQLAAIGVADTKSPPECWRVSRLETPRAALPANPGGSDPECSRALLRWRSILARSSHPSPYRISRI